MCSMEQFVTHFTALFLLYPSVCLCSCYCRCYWYQRVYYKRPSQVVYTGQSLKKKKKKRSDTCDLCCLYAKRSTLVYRIYVCNLRVATPYGFALKLNSFNWLKNKLLRKIFFWLIISFCKIKIKTTCIFCSVQIKCCI